MGKRPRPYTPSPSTVTKFGRHREPTFSVRMTRSTWVTVLGVARAQEMQMNGHSVVPNPFAHRKSDLDKARAEFTPHRTDLLPPKVAVKSVLSRDVDEEDASTVFDDDDEDGD